MAGNKKATAPVSSVRADGKQPLCKNNYEKSISNSQKQSNLQATNCPEKSGHEIWAGGFKDGHNGGIV